MDATVKKDIVHFDPTSLRAVEKATAFSRFYFSPQYFGLENVDALKPALYVSNHSIYGVLDSPLLFEKLLKDKNIVLRSLGDHFHFEVPLWRDIMTEGGAVPGTRDVVNLMRLQRTDLDLGIDTEKAALFGVPAIEADRTVRIDLICEPDVAERIAEHVLQAYATHYSVSLHFSEVWVVRPDRF